MCFCYYHIIENFLCHNLVDPTLVKNNDQNTSDSRSDENKTSIEENGSNKNVILNIISAIKLFLIFMI